MAKQRFEFREGASAKFWQIEVKGKKYVVEWGKIGTKGQSKETEFADAKAAQIAAKKLIAQKTGKGYEPVSATAAEAKRPKAVAAKTKTAKASTERAGATPKVVDLLADQLRTLCKSPGKTDAGFLGAGVGAEIRTWGSLVGTDVELDEESLKTLAPLKLSRVVEELDGNYVARFRGLFAGLSLIVEGDESGLMASWVPLPSGSSQTYEVHQDEWSASKAAPSIGGALVKKLDDPLPDFANAYAAFDKGARKEKFDAHLDPAALWKASEWLVDVFLDISVKDLDGQLKAALAFASWSGNKDAIADWPQLLNYWLLAHWAFGNDEALKETLEIARNVKHPATLEISGFVEKGQLKNADAILNKRNTLLAMAPSKALSPEAKKRRQALEKELKSESPEVVSAKKEIQSDPSPSDAAKLFDELVALSAKDAYSREVYQRRPQAIREFADVVDERWLPVLLHHQCLAARFVDSHKLAIPGLILAIAKLSKDYQTFRKRIDQFGVGAFGLQRKEEHAIAVGLFVSDPGALKWLVDDATAWAKRIDEWDVPVSDAYEHVLLKHPLPETFGLIQRVLSAKDFHGGNWRICVDTAVAAGRLKAVPALDALRSALEKGLGRKDNGERAAIEKALKQVEAAARG